MACACGHAIEEHENETGPCEGTNMVQKGKGRSEEPCQCVLFEDDGEDDDE